MESPALTTTASFTLFTISKALNRNFNFNRTSSFLLSRRRFSSLLHNSSASSHLTAFSSVLPSVRRRLQCLSNTSSFSTSNGGNGGRPPFGGDGGGDGGGVGGGDSKNLVAGEVENVSALSPDVIILDVGGMTCGGCAASVKKILESQPQVSSATVNLTTETAVVWPVSKAKVLPNWQKQLGEALAKHLTTCGFTSNLRVAGEEAIEGDI